MKALALILAPIGWLLFGQGYPGFAHGNMTVPGQFTGTAVDGGKLVTAIEVQATNVDTTNLDAGFVFVITDACRLGGPCLSDAGGGSVAGGIWRQSSAFILQPSDGGPMAINVAAVDGGGEVFAGQFCLPTGGGGCITSWPSGGVTVNQWLQDSALDYTPIDAGIGITVATVDAGGVALAATGVWTTTPDAGLVISGNTSPDGGTAAITIENDTAQISGNLLNINNGIATVAAIGPGGALFLDGGSGLKLTPSSTGWTLNGMFTGQTVAATSSFQGPVLEGSSTSVAIEGDVATGPSVYLNSGKTITSGPILAGNAAFAAGYSFKIGVQGDYWADGGEAAFGAWDGGGVALFGTGVWTTTPDAGLLLTGNISPDGGSAAVTVGNATAQVSGAILNLNNGPTLEAQVDNSGNVYANEFTTAPGLQDTASGNVLVVGQIKDQATATATPPVLQLSNKYVLDSGLALQIDNGPFAPIASVDYSGGITGNAWDGGGLSIFYGGSTQGAVLQSLAPANPGADPTITLSGNCGSNNACTGIRFLGSAAGTGQMDGGGGGLINIQRSAGTADFPFIDWNLDLQIQGNLDVLGNSTLPSQIQGYSSSVGLNVQAPVGFDGGDVEITSNLSVGGYAEVVSGVLTPQIAGIGAGVNVEAPVSFDAGNIFMAQNLIVDGGIYTGSLCIGGGACVASTPSTTQANVLTYWDGGLIPTAITNGLTYHCEGGVSPNTAVGFSENINMGQPFKTLWDTCACSDPGSMANFCSCSAADGGFVSLTFNTQSFRYWWYACGY